MATVFLVAQKGQFWGKMTHGDLDLLFWELSGPL